LKIRSKCQRHLDVERERRVAAGEDQLEPLVGNGGGLVHRFLRRIGKLAGQHPGFLGECPLPPDMVDRAVAGCRDQPAGRVGRLAITRPAFRGDRERLLGRVLSQFDIAEESGHRCEHPCAHAAPPCPHPGRP
jgi:hypothetical protein